MFVAKREEGETDQADTGSKDPDGLVKVIAVVAMYHGSQEMEGLVEECVRITQVLYVEMELVEPAIHDTLTPL